MASKAWIDDLPPAVQKRLRRVDATLPSPVPARGALPTWYLARFTDDDRIVVLDGDDHRVVNVRSSGSGSGGGGGSGGGSGSGDTPQGATGSAIALIDISARAPVSRLASGTPYPPTSADRAAISLWLGLLGAPDELEAALQLEDAFRRRYWTLLRFPGPGLVTCDRPLKTFKGGGKWRDTPEAIADADEVWFPLDRSTAVIFHSAEVVGEKVTDAPVTFPIDNFNQEIVGNARREVFCHPADFERVAQLRLATRKP